MPIRDYECKNEACSHKFEQLYLSFSEEEREQANLRCPKCGSADLERLMSSGTSFQLKGSGYYSTDYKNKHNPRGRK
jgi:putative FmdB family regulatory protein